jgi:Family of unknown function (DUF6492)
MRRSGWKALTGDSVLSGAGFRTFSQDPDLEPRRCRTDTGNGEQGMTTSVAFVTVSYGPDRDRCALLSRSLEEFAPSVDHLIVVDRADLAQFRSLESGTATLVATEDVLPLWLRRLDIRRIGLRSNLWIQGRGRPVRGWLVQQLVKLALAAELTADVLVHVDSDVVLVRPFQSSSITDQAGRIRLVEQRGAIDESMPKHVAWHRSAEKLLGIERGSLPLPDFITSLVPWKRENAVALIEHIERNTGRHWLRALAAAWNVSEYTLYGRFVRDVLGENAGQFVTSSSLCHDYWTHAPLSESELEVFFDGIGPDEVAVSITAKAGMSPADYVGALERRWAALRE